MPQKTWTSSSLDLQVQKVYDFIWDEFCDWYIEIAKVRTYKKDENPESANARLWTLKMKNVMALKPFHPTYAVYHRGNLSAHPVRRGDYHALNWIEYKEEGISC